MTTERPGFLMRLCVVVGGATLLLGLVGAVMLIFVGDGHGDDRGPGLGPDLRLSGPGVHTELQVLVQWSDRGLLTTQAARRLDSAGTRWLLPPLPADAEVDLVVRDERTSPASLRLRQRLPSPVPNGFRVRIPAPGNEGLDEGARDGR